MMDAAVRLLGTRFQQVEKLFVMSEKFADRNHENVVAGGVEPGQRISLPGIKFAIGLRSYSCWIKQVSKSR